VVNPYLVMRAVPVRLVLRFDDHVRDVLRDLSLVTASSGAADSSSTDLLGALRELVGGHAPVCIGDRTVAEAAYEQRLERVDVPVPPTVDAAGVVARWREAFPAAESRAELAGTASAELVEFQEEWVSEVCAQLGGAEPTPDPFPRSWAALLATGELARSAGGRVVPVELRSGRAELTAELPVDPDPREVRKARRWLHATLELWDADDLVEVAVLALSEVLTNALLHAPGRVHIHTELTAGCLRIEVWDDGASMPSRRRHSDETMSGRGLELVDAVTSRWGASPQVTGEGKAVWFEVDRVDAA
jgi:anti-sigma regulatory factor (Ser/Thr protein kinase)